MKLLYDVVAVCRQLIIIN